MLRTSPVHQATTYSRHMLVVVVVVVAINDQRAWATDGRTDGGWTDAGHCGMKHARHRTVRHGVAPPPCVRVTADVVSCPTITLNDQRRPSSSHTASYTSSSTSSMQWLSPRGDSCASCTAEHSTTPQQHRAQIRGRGADELQLNV